jgi:cytochrome P450
MFSYDPYSWKIQDDPYPYYKILRDEYPAYFIETRNLWVITRYADCMAALQNPGVWSSAASGNIIDDSPGRIGRTLGTTDPPRHEELRRLVTKAFTPASVAKLEPVVRRTVLELIDAFISDRACDFTGQFAAPLTASIVGYMLGIPKEDHARLRVWTEAAVTRSEGGGHAETFAESFKKLTDYIAELVKRRRKAPQEDLISGLIAAEDAGARLSDEEIIITAATMIGAAFESTNLMLGNALVALHRYPDQLKEVRENPALIPEMIEESLRWDTSTHGFLRTTTQDIRIEDTVVPAGSRAFLVFAAANRDERQFPDPDRFDIHRKIGRHHLGFGWGIHICLGAPLARLEMKVAFEELLPRLGNYDIDPAHATRSHGPQFRGYQDLPVTY